MKSLITILLYLFSINSLACEALGPGAGLQAEALIDSSKNIFVVELANLDEAGFHKLYTLRVVEVLKGKVNGELEFMGFAEHHVANDFENHQNRTFWENDIGRSDWPCCICGPDHTFRKGFKYLYFPDYVSAMKSAEIVLDKSDKWYSFVKSRVNE